MSPASSATTGSRPVSMESRRSARTTGTPGASRPGGGPQPSWSGEGASPYTALRARNAETLTYPPPCLGRRWRHPDRVTPVEILI